MKEAIAQYGEWKSLGRAKNATSKRYVDLLRVFALYMHNPDIEQIKLGDILTYQREMEYLGWENNSLIQRACALRDFFYLFHKQGFHVLDHELIPMPRKEFKRPPRVASDANYEKMLAVIPEDSLDPRHIRNQAMIRMMADCGGRVSEIYELEMDELDINRMKSITNTKKSRGTRPFRELMWSKETNRYLLKWLACRETLYNRSPFPDAEAVFVSISGVKYGCHMNDSGVTAILRSYCLKAKVPYINPHSLRHRFCRQIAERGSTSDVMNLAGHATLASSTIYTTLYGNELEKLYTRLFPERRGAWN